MKPALFILFMIISCLGFCQTDSLTNKDIEVLTLLNESVECRVSYENDSIMKLAAKHDAEKNFNSNFKKYYRIGNASGILFQETQKLAFSKYQIILEYTHCSPCKYQIQYNSVFRVLYQKDTNRDLDKLILEIEQEARKEFEKKIKR